MNDKIIALIAILEFSRPIVPSHDHSALIVIDYCISLCNILLNADDASVEHAINVFTPALNYDMRGGGGNE